MNAKRNPAVMLSGILIFLFVLVMSLNAGAAGPEQEQGVVPLKGGGFVVFDLKIQSPLPMAVSSSVDGSESNLIHRVLIDEKNNFYLGYDLEVEVQPAKFDGGSFQPGQFKLTFGPLSAAHVAGLQANPKLANLSPHPEFNQDWFFRSATPQLLKSLDSIAIELLVNPATGAKIIDVISVNMSPTAAWFNKRPFGNARDFSIDDVEMSMSRNKLLINGECVSCSGSGSVSGPLVYFWVRGRGRFIVSLRAHDGYDFQKIGTIQQNKIVFFMNGDYYEWICAEPIMKDGGFWNVWVLHEPDYDFQADLARKKGGGGVGIRGNLTSGQPPQFGAGMAVNMELLIPKK